MGSAADGIRRWRSLLPWPSKRQTMVLVGGGIRRKCRPKTCRRVNRVAIKTGEGRHKVMLEYLEEQKKLTINQWKIFVDRSVNRTGRPGRDRRRRRVPPAMPLLRRPHDHRRELRTRRRTSRPARAASRRRDRNAMTPITAASQLLPTGEPRLRHCTAVAPPSPKPPLAPSIRPKSPRRPPPRRRSWHCDRRSDANYVGRRIPYPSRRPVKSP